MSPETSPVPRWLVVGGDGAIGSALADHLATKRTGAGEPVLVTSRRPESRPVSGWPGVERLRLDLAEPEAFWPALPEGPGVAFICAAAARHEQCKRDPAGSRAVNVKGTLALVRRLRAGGMRVVWLSTNQVFDGSVPHQRADAPPSPRSTYGLQKAETERALLAMGEGVCILRLSKVVTPGMPLVEGWLAAFREGRSVRPFHDMVIAPVAVDTVVEAMVRAGERGLSGLLQLTGPEDMGYDEVARLLAEAVGAPAGLVEPISWRDATSDLEWVPRHTTLDLTRLVEEVGIQPEDGRTTLLRVCLGRLSAERRDK